MKKPRIDIKEQKKWLSSPKIALLLVALLILAIPTFMLLRYDMKVSHSLPTALNDAQKITSSLDEISGTVHKIVKDSGCNYGGVGLERQIRCEVTAQRLFKHNGDLSQDIQALNKELNSLGYATQASPLDGSAYNKTIQYTNTDSPDTTINLSYYRNDKSNDYWISPLIKSDNLPAPSSSSEYIYGIMLTSTYYACNESPWGFKCPTPPSQPK